MDGEADHLGIMPRTVRFLFKSDENAANLGWEYTITASFLEIYNEEFYDLVDDFKAKVKTKSETYIKRHEVTKASELFDLLKTARFNRSTAATVGNERSSRSYAVTQLEIVGKRRSYPEKLIGFINLVDLAGSESPKTSQHMDETKNINKSLSALTDVILALVQKNDHIPYRNSKLTQLLMPSLGGNSKTLMFVNVSPLQEHFNQSIMSLRFATSVNSIKQARATRNREVTKS